MLKNIWCNTSKKYYFIFVSILYILTIFFNIGLTIIILTFTILYSYKFVLIINYNTNKFNYFTQVLVAHLLLLVIVLPMVLTIQLIYWVLLNVSQDIYIITISRSYFISYIAYIFVKIGRHESRVYVSMQLFLLKYGLDGLLIILYLLASNFVSFDAHLTFFVTFFSFR